MVEISLQPGVAAVEFLTQAGNRHVDGAVERVRLASPGPVQQLLAGKHAAGSLDKAGEQIELGTGQSDLFAIRTLKRARIQIHHEPLKRMAAVAGAFCLTACASQDRPHPRQQFARIERLGQIVVRAHFQAEHSVDILALGGEHQNR
jgi:hypothetical protein